MTRLIATLLLMVTAVPAAAQTAARPPAQLLADREAVWRAYFEGDSARLTELLPERMNGMDGKHRADIIRDARAFAAGGGQFIGITFEDRDYYERGDVAITWARYRVRLRNTQGPFEMNGVAIELFERRDGRWINPSWHLHEAP